MRFIEDCLATFGLRIGCVVVATILSTSCSVTSDDSVQAGRPGFGSALASVLSQAEVQLSSDQADGQMAPGFAGGENGGIPAPVVGDVDTGRSPASGSAPSEIPASKKAAATPQVAAASPDAAKAGLAAEPPAPAPVAGHQPSAGSSGKRSFLSSLFGSEPAVAASPRPITDLGDKPAATAKPPKPLLNLASTGGSSDENRRVFSDDALPGVRQNSLFEITRKSGLDDDSDIDVHEAEPSVQMASAAGLARLAPNGLLKQTEGVDVGCLKPSLVRMLKTVEQHFGKKMIVTSGYRNPERNRKARGARNSMHMYCAAADVQVPGVDKWQLAKYVRGMPGRGGVGTYCHTNSIHIDVGPERDWNWRCAKRRS